MMTFNKYLFMVQTLFIFVRSSNDSTIINLNCDGRIAIDNCGIFYLHLPNTIRLYYKSVDCSKVNFAYSWDLPGYYSGNTKVPVWTIPVMEKKSPMKKIALSVELKEKDKPDQKKINLKCEVSTKLNPNKIMPDVRTFKSGSRFYQQVSANYCSISTPDRGASFTFTKTHGITTKEKQEGVYGSGYDVYYRRDITKGEKVAVEVRMIQKDQDEISEEVSIDQYYYPQMLYTYYPQKEQYVYNQYCLKNCACPRREYTIHTKVHLVASELEHDAYKNYTHFPKRRVEHYLFIPVLEDALFKGVFRNHQAFKIYTNIGHIAYTAFLLKENSFFSDQYKCNINPENSIRALVDIVNIKCDVKPPYYSMTYRIEQKINNEYITITEMIVPNTNVRLLPSGNSEGVFITLVTPAKAIQRHEFNIKVENYLKDVATYSELMKVINAIFSNNNPEVPSPQRLFQLSLFDEAVATLAGLLWEIVLYEPKTKKEARLKQTHLGEFSAQSIELLMKFKNKTQALHARMTIILPLISAPPDIDYRVKLSEYCKELVDQRIGDEDVFGLGAHAEVEDLVYEDYDQEYKLIRTCATYVASGNWKPKCDLEASEIEKIHMKLVKIYYNYRQMVFSMSSLRIKECFFCDVDDEVGTGHLLYSIVTFTGKTVTFTKKTFSAKSCSYTIYSHTFSYSLYGTLVNLIVPIQPSVYYVGDKLNSFLFSSIATVYGILVVQKKGNTKVLDKARMDFMFPNVRHPIDRSLFKSEHIFLPPMDLPRNSTDYLILEVGAFRGKSTCVEIINASKPLTIHATVSVKPEIGYTDILIPEGRGYRHCFPVAKGDARFFVGVKHEREHMVIRPKPKPKLKGRKKKKLKPSDEEFQRAHFIYTSYALACSRLKEKKTWIIDESFGWTDDNMLRCSGSTIEDVAILATPLIVKLHYPSYHFHYEYEHGFEPQINWRLYLPVLIALLLYCLLWIFLLYRNLHPQAVYFLSDNHKEERYAYMIEVTTGKDTDAGTTSNITIKVFGDHGNSRAHVLNYPDPDWMLLRTNSLDYFIMTTGKHLGNLSHIQLWSDFISLQPRWKCEKVRICDLQTKHWWTFPVNSWLTIDQDNFHCLRTNNNSGNPYKKSPFHQIFLAYFNANHTWNITSSFSSFYTSTEKVTIVLSHVLWVCSLTMLFCINPRIHPSDARELEKVTDVYVLKLTFKVSFIAFLINAIFVLLFRCSDLTEKELYVYIPNYFSRSIRWITWIFLTILIAANIVYVFVFSLYISYDTSMKMLGFIVLSLLWIIFVWEFLFIILMNLVNWMKSPVEIKKYYYNRIIAECEEQRAMMTRIFTNIANMRPYLIHLYKPLGVDVVTVKRRIIARIVTVKKYSRYILFLICYICLLHLLITANRNNLIQFHNEHVKNMIIGELSMKRANYTLLTDISSLASVRPYISEIILETLNPKVWYGNFPVIENRLLTDFQTKYFGRLSLRVIAVHRIKIPGGKLAKSLTNLSKIYPEFSMSNEDDEEKKSTLEEWTYHTAISSGRDSFQGEFAKYPGGGFIKKIDSTEMKKRDRQWWLEKSSRAIFIEFLTYNNNINTFTSVRIVIEKSATGLTLPSIFVSSHSLTYRGQWTNLLIRITMYSLIFLTIFYFLITARNMIITKSFWDHTQIMDVVIIFAMIILVALFHKKNAAVDLLHPNLNFESNDVIIKYFSFFNTAEKLTIFVGFTLWLLIIGISLYLKFVTSDVVLYRLLISWNFLGLVLTHLIFLSSSLLIGYLLFNHSKNFQTISFLFQDILVLRCLRNTNSYEIIGYSPLAFPIFFFIFSLFLFYMFALYIAYFNWNYTREKRQMEFFWFSRYSIWNYLQNNFSFYSRYFRRRTKFLKLAGGRSTKCDRIYFKANHRRFCGSFTSKESTLEAIRHIVFGILYIRYLREDRPLNHKDVTVMLGIAESYIKRNDSVDLVYYRDCKPDKSHYMTERRMTLMEVVLDRMLQKRRIKRREEEESIRDMLTLQRLDNLIFQLNALNDTLTVLLDY